jgi:hypothetical protein
VATGIGTVDLWTRKFVSRSPDSSVSIVTVIQAERMENRDYCPAVADICIASAVSRPVVDLTHPHIQRLAGVFFPG